jgi:FdhE protein
MQRVLDATDGVDAQAAPFIMAALQVCQTRTVCSLRPDEVTERAAGLHIPGTCPMCGALPVASVVRAEKAYQGSRYLHLLVSAAGFHRGSGNPLLWQAS